MEINIDFINVILSGGGSGQWQIFKWNIYYFWPFALFYLHFFCIFFLTLFYILTKPVLTILRSCPCNQQKDITEQNAFGFLPVYVQNVNVTSFECFLWRKKRCWHLKWWMVVGNVSSSNALLTHFFRQMNIYWLMHNISSIYPI